MKEIEKHLKNLRLIEPRADFVMRSKRLILAVSPPITTAISHPFPRLKEFVGFALGVTMTAAVLVALFSNFYIYSGRSAALAKFQIMQKEAETSIKHINITLSEIQYYTETARETSLALNEAAANNMINHLNSAGIEEKIQDPINIETIKNPQIDDLLNQAIF